jgi:ribokinase
MTQLELGVDLAHRALAEGKRAGCRTVLTAAPAPTTPLPAALWRVVDVLLVNRHEAAVLADADDVATEQAEVIVAHLAASLGVAAIVVTLGADGAVAWDAGQVARLPTRAVPVVDTLGAGDALAGVLASGLARGQALFAALPAAIAAGSLATTRAGAFDALPTAAAIAALLQRRSD